MSVCASDRMSGLHHLACLFSPDSKNNPAISQSSGNGGRSRAAKKNSNKTVTIPPIRRRNGNTFYHRVEGGARREAGRGQTRSTISHMGMPRNSLQLKWDCGLKSDTFRYCMTLLQTHLFLLLHDCQ